MATDTISNDELEAIAAEVHAVVETLVTEDDTPVDNVFSEKQQRLLTEPLFSSWSGPGQPRPFVAMANVGLFYAIRRPPLVPDVLLSLGVEMPADIHLKSNRSYFTWEYGKAPEVVIEVVSNREGGEDTGKLAAYAEIGVRYYVIYDPERMLGAEELRVYRLEGLSFHRLDEPIWFRDVGLGLGLWQGRYEDLDCSWLRWVDAKGTPVATGRERADAERERADAERERADAERERAEAERNRAEQLAAQLRQLGVEPR
jgi:Uma2 family endonuclease